MGALVEQAPGGTRHTFRAAQRLRKRPEFQRVYNRGERVRTRLMTLLALPNERGISRLGIAATRKLGGAVVRNRAKRRVRDIFRRSDIPPGVDIVVIPRPDLLDADFRTLEADFRYALRRAVRRPRPGQ
ncbi:MAG TPA: ribonuclease P protein component [Vicinamibacterales bacterium]|jgi:ribonuclease P protein component